MIMMNQCAHKGLEGWQLRWGRDYSAASAEVDDLTNMGQRTAVIVVQWWWPVLLKDKNEPMCSQCAHKVTQNQNLKISKDFCEKCRCLQLVRFPKRVQRKLCQGFFFFPLKSFHSMAHCVSNDSYFSFNMPWKSLQGFKSGKNTFMDVYLFSSPPVKIDQNYRLSNSSCLTSIY